MDIEVLEQTPLSMPLLKAKLEELKKDKKELNFRAAKVLEHLNENTLLDEKQAEDLRKKLTELNIPRIREKHLAKIIDLAPQDAEEVKTILVGENITLKPEDLKRIVDTIKG